MVLSLVVGWLLLFLLDIIAKIIKLKNELNIINI